MKKYVNHIISILMFLSQTWQMNMINTMHLMPTLITSTTGKLL